MENLILVEQPEGVPWLVAHNAATGQVAFYQALPPWASQGLADAVTGWLCAAVDAYCTQCEAIRPAAPPEPDVPRWDPDADAPQWPFGGPPEHAEWCQWSAEAIDRQREACQPAGAQWTADFSDECAEGLKGYLLALLANIRDIGQDGG